MHESINTSHSEVTSRTQTDVIQTGLAQSSMVHKTCSLLLTMDLWF